MRRKKWKYGSVYEGNGGRIHHSAPWKGGGREEGRGGILFRVQYTRHGGKDPFLVFSRIVSYREKKWLITIRVFLSPKSPPCIAINMRRGPWILEEGGNRCFVCQEVWRKNKTKQQRRQIWRVQFSLRFLFIRQYFSSSWLKWWWDRHDSQKFSLLLPRLMPEMVGIKKTFSRRKRGREAKKRRKGEVICHIKRGGENEKGFSSSHHLAKWCGCSKRGNLVTF